MREFDPFGDATLADIIRFDRGDEWRVQTREGTTKEFKESFSWGSIAAFARTMAAFANARGGYIIFGVTDSPRLATGLSEVGFARLDALDQARLTESLNNLFSPELHWAVTIFDLHGRHFGAIYTHEAEIKPVIAKKSISEQNGRISEGDILYRYNSRTERIKYPELVAILDDAKVREARAMIRHVEGLLRAGASNAAVLDFGSRELRGPTGQTVLLDEELLSKISFIKKGEFDEVHGAPTLRLIGDVVPVTTVAVGPREVINAALSPDLVLRHFLERKVVGNGEEYAKQIAIGGTAFLPVHYYRRAAGLTDEQLLTYLGDITTRSQAKDRLLERVRMRNPMRQQQPSQSTQYVLTVARRRHFEALSRGEASSVDLDDPEEVRSFLQALAALESDRLAELDEALQPILLDCFERHYGTDARVADALRRAACRIDFALYGPEAA